jgi:hypothetical protein
MSELCPLWGVKRTFTKRFAMSANDPKRTSSETVGVIVLGLCPID